MKNFFLILCVCFISLSTWGASNPLPAPSPEVQAADKKLHEISPIDKNSIQIIINEIQRLGEEAVKKGKINIPEGLDEGDVPLFLLQNYLGRTGIEVLEFCLNKNKKDVQPKETNYLSNWSRLILSTATGAITGIGKQYDPKNEAHRLFMQTAILGLYMQWVAADAMGGDVLGRYRQSVLSTLFKTSNNESQRTILYVMANLVQKYVMGQLIDYASFAKETASYKEATAENQSWDALDAATLQKELDLSELQRIDTYFELKTMFNKVQQEIVNTKNNREKWEEDNGNNTQPNTNTNPNTVAPSSITADPQPSIVPPTVVASPSVPSSQKSTEEGKKQEAATEKEQKQGLVVPPQRISSVKQQDHATEMKAIREGIGAFTYFEKVVSTPAAHVKTFLQYKRIQLNDPSKENTVKKLANMALIDRRAQIMEAMANPAKFRLFDSAVFKDEQEAWDFYGAMLAVHRISSGVLNDEGKFLSASFDKDLKKSSDNKDDPDGQHHVKILYALFITMEKFQKKIDENIGQKNRILSTYFKSAQYAQYMNALYYKETLDRCLEQAMKDVGLEAVDRAECQKHMQRILWRDFVKQYFKDEPLDALKKRKKFDISGSDWPNFKVIPDGINTLTELETLNLSNKRPISLPDFSALKKLKVLILENVFPYKTPFPKWITSLPELEELDISSNVISDIPETFNRQTMPKLKKLKVGYSIPEDQRERLKKEFGEVLVEE